MIKFNSDVFDLYPPRNVEFNLSDSNIPSDKDIFFRAKQKETLDRYQAARRFMYEIDTDDWGHYFKPVDNDIANNYFQTTYRSQFYEAALIFYNTVVDLSWISCYVSLEYSVYLNGGTIETERITSVEEAYNALRCEEKLIEHPRSDNTPFNYLKSMCPEYSDIIDYIIDFWDNFGTSSIRANYNFFKHKGKLCYKEIQQLEPNRIFSFRVNDKLCPSDVRDVQKAICLSDSIKELMDFDNNLLYPYIQGLFHRLEKLVKPSPFIF